MPEPVKAKEEIVPVGIWLRVSTEDQARGESPLHHEMRAKSYAEAKGWKVVELYDLSGVSGKSVVNHPEAKRMMQHVRDGRIKSLVFSKLARLARNTKELLDFADYFREHNANLVSLSESIDTSTPAGRLFYSMIASMATWEREEISDRVALSVPVRAKLGKNTGGAATYGYQWKDGKLMPDTGEAPVRRLVHELFKEHRRKKTVARLLNERGHRTRNGSLFTDTTIERLLDDPTPKGIRKANYTKSLGQGKAATIKPERDWIYTEVPAIIEESLWNECQSILTEQRLKKKPARKTVQLFGGVTYCHCNSKMYVKSNSPKYVCTTCKNKIPIDDLEAIFVNELKSFVFSEDEIASYLTEGSEMLQSKEQEIVLLEKEASSTQKELDKLYELYLKDGISIDSFKKRNGPLEYRKTQIENTLPKLEGECSAYRLNLLSKDVVIQEARDLSVRFPKLPFEGKRQIVETIVEKIIIGLDDIEIALHYLPPKQGKMATNDQGFIAVIN
jgi:site-specific DNA recombinase